MALDRTKSVRSIEGQLRQAAVRISSVLGRLIRIAAWRDRAAGQLPGDLAARYGADEIERVLEQLHVETFLEWLNSSLRQQTDDLELYIRSSGAGQCELDALRDLVDRSIPAGRSELERRLVQSDLEVVTLIARAEIQIF